MTMYGRSDYCSITIPQPDGCGAQHTKEVTRGVPARHIRIDCEPCEAYLSGARKPKILKYQIDAKTGQALRQERVADVMPGWSSTPDTVPLTPDQEKTYHLRIERGEQQLRALESLATLSKAGIDFKSREDVLFYLREQELPENLLQGSKVCVNGHDVPAGNQFCGSCGASMDARAAIGSAPEDTSGEPEIDLERLHPQTLRKMCRDAKLPDRGSKEALIGRLQAAA